MRFIFTSAVVFFMVLLSTPENYGYGVLTHEAVIDATWDESIKSLLKKKFPGATEEQLKEAHAYVYGGAIIPDIGYYPYGSLLFTHLVHYVRTGDFVTALFDEAQNIDEYAFALGVLCHYEADNYGHPLGTNRAVPIVFKTMKKKYGDEVTYAQDPIKHLRMEFSFDVLQVARGKYAPKSYHDFIGFEVSKEVLQRAFLKTYGLDINDVFGNFNKAINTFRWAVKNVMPELTEDAWITKRTYITELNPSMNTRKNFIFNMSKTNYYSEFGKDRVKPGVSSVIISLIIRAIPKFGPMKALKFTEPVPEAEKLFTESFDSVVLHYSRTLEKIREGNDKLLNLNYDTGKKIVAGDYPPTDDTYSDWLLFLKKENFNCVDSKIKNNIEDFYKNSSAPITTKKHSKKWYKTTDALAELKGLNLNIADENKN